MAAPLRVALGAEFRADRYEITAGDPDSYRDGGVKVLDASGEPTTRLAAIGAQVVPGLPAESTPARTAAATARRTSISRAI